MPKIYKPGKVAVVLQGRHAGKKVVVIKQFDDGSKEHGFPYVIAAGIERYPLKVTKGMGAKKLARRSKIKPFVKVINYNHLFPTRYALELEGLKGVASNETFKEVSQREDARKEIKKLFEERFQSGKNRWFFTPLRATCTAPVNIAVVKYWGKRDTALILPTNDSLSVTLDQDDLRTVTTARADASFGGGASSRDRLWLNGVEEEISAGGRLAACLAELRRLRAEREAADAALPPLSQWGLHLCSENNFPTAAGLASSASGFAALAATVAQLYELGDVLAPSALSMVARRGSGSACRSLFGGFVAWSAGTRADGTDSLAVPVAPREHWPDLEMLVCVVNDGKKGTSSTAGMQRTVQTSPLLQHRIAHVVPARMKRMADAIHARDFTAFAQLTAADSNNFHACCLDTAPPIFYMNDTSRAIVTVVEELNRAAAAAGRDAVAAYTFDAGPNAVLYVRKGDIPTVLRVVRHYFPDADFDDKGNLLGAGAGKSHRGEADAQALPELPPSFNADVISVQPTGSVRRMIHTRVGDGPRVLERGCGAASLLKDDGLPLRLQRAKR
ncbi:diphosphomevalonate decarboxylase [Malassezia sp. CBS 17886]|nr:diphosphomevalonate decarboxylase [Malassezia sp. CBS 17886]